MTPRRRAHRRLAAPVAGLACTAAAAVALLAASPSPTTAPAGGLPAVAALMDEVADGLHAATPAARLEPAQQRILTLLDDAIAAAEQQEHGATQRTESPSDTPGQTSGLPTDPADVSAERRGTGTVGPLGTMPGASPADAWGQLPPAERERILQGLRARYPARYGELVEQYYRALAEEQ